MMRTVAWMMMMASVGSTASWAGVASTAGVASADVASERKRDDRVVLRAGDVLAFLGDSNTEWGSYPKRIERALSKRRPELGIRVVNAGESGDSAMLGFYRLEKDVFEKGATVVFVAFGVNDINWGKDQSESTRKWHLDSIRDIVAECLKHGVRVVVLSYPMTEESLDPAEDARAVGEITRDSGSYLQRLGNEAMKISRELGGSAIDVQSEMRARARWLMSTGAPFRYTAEDGVHLNDLGNRWLTDVILSGLRTE